jgi:hypothetical protein
MSVVEPTCAAATLGESKAAIKNAKCLIDFIAYG